MQTELLPESGAPVSRNGRRGHHRKAASDTFAWAASAFLGELPAQAEEVPSELGVAAVNPGNTPATNRYIPATAINHGFNRGGIPAESIYDYLDVDEDEVLEADEVDVDTYLDDNSFGERANLSPAFTDPGQTAAAPGGPSVTASSGHTAPFTLAPDCARGPSLHDQTKPASRLRGSTGGAAAGSKRGAGDGDGAGPASRHMRHPSDPQLGFSQGAAPLLPLPLDKPFSEFTGQTRANAFDPSQLDPKRAKRIIANRQSAHRSRMKKLQAIHALEERVDASKTATETLRQQVAAATTQRRQALGTAAEAQRQLAALQQELAMESQWQDALVNELMKLGVAPTAPPAVFPARDLGAKQLRSPGLSEPQPPLPTIMTSRGPMTSSGGSIASPLTPLPLSAAPDPAPALGPFQYTHTPTTGLPRPQGACTAVTAAPVSTCSPLLSPLACSSRTAGMLLPLSRMQPPLAACNGAIDSPSSGCAAGLAPAGPSALHAPSAAMPHPPLPTSLHPSVHPQQMIMMSTGLAITGPRPQPTHTLGGPVIAPPGTDVTSLTAAAGLLGAPPVVSPTLLPQHPHGQLHPQLHPPYHLQLPLPPAGLPMNGAACHMGFASCMDPSPVGLSAAAASAFYNPAACLAAGAGAHPAGLASGEAMAATAVCGGGGEKANGYLQGDGVGEIPAESGVLIAESPMALGGLDGMDSLVMTDLATYLGAGLGEGGSVGGGGHADSGFVGG